MSAHSPTDDLRDLRAVFFRGVDLDAAERAVMGVLILHRNGQTGRTDPSVTTIAAETGYCRRVIITALGALERRGHLTRDPRPGLRTRYTVHAPTSAPHAPVQEMHQCTSCTGPVQEMHGTGAPHAPERTKERAKERTEVESELWPAYVEAFDGARLKLTHGRRQQLAALHAEQLKGADDPLALFRAILRAVKASDHHMSKVEYRLPESLFRNEERRERWTLKGLELLNGKAAPGAARDPLMFTTAELRSREEAA